jgi:hypothetical protein
MSIKILSLVVLLFVGALAGKGKIRILNEKNMEQFSKDNSYWLIQISSK